MTLTGRRVVLGVSGGIACYKTCTVARRLTEMGAAVDVVLTASAGQFIRPVTFEALTGRPVATSLWDRDAALAHLSLGQDTDLIIVAPATAHLIARAAQGLADDLLTALLLAATVPVLLAPAMNDRMYAHPATQANLAGLMKRGWAVVGPEVGPLAEGSSDRPGRMSEPEKIIASAGRMMRGAQGPLAGKRVLVTAGPTRESLDPVRVVTNRSSGRMGYALATAAFGRGAEVTLITGPTSLEPPFGVDVVTVESTEDLRGAMAKQVHSADIVVMAAAPADFRVPSAATGKIKRADGAVDLRLEPTVDVLESTKHLRPEGCLVIGFALETSDGVENARDKLARKGLDLIVLNMANEPGAGFEEETNRVTLVGTDSLTELPLLPKAEVAERILDAVEALT
jgi:phosphopantothenoylcysteine decarboxylase/phosphopantothenate--cysteine ligase